MLQERPQIDALKESFPWGIFSNKTALGQPEAGQHPSLHFLTSRIRELAWGTGHLGDVSLVSAWGREHLAGVSLTRDIDGCLKELQAMGIRFNHLEEAHEYLLRFPDTIEATVKIAEVALTHLPDAQLTLEVYQDPEIEDRHLVLYARFKDYAQPVMGRIREVRRECRRYLIGKKGWLQLTTDFQPAE